MTRAERSEYTYIKNFLKKDPPKDSTQVTISTESGAEYKQALDELYRGYGFRPVELTKDPRRFDGRERLVYISWAPLEAAGFTYEDLTTEKERALYAAKLA